MIEKLADGRTDLIIELVRDGYRPDSCDTTGISLLQWCAYYGDVTAVKFLCLHGGTVRDLGPDFGLIGAAYHGHWQLCQFLLEQGANANYHMEDSGETALHAAICKANNPVATLIVQVLLAHNADPNSRTNPRCSTEGFMRDAFTRQETPLHRAAAYGNVAMIQLLLEAGADKTAKDMNGDSPLSWASWHLRSDLILSMLCFGDYSIHPERIKRAREADNSVPYGPGMYLNGQVHA